MFKLSLFLLIAASSAYGQADINVVVVGDSHLAGYLQTNSIPAMATAASVYRLHNLAISGSKFCRVFADNGPNEQQVDALYNPTLSGNILLLEGGGNDILDNNIGNPPVAAISPQAVYECQRAYAQRRKERGWQIVLYPMYSRGQTGFNNLTGDQAHDLLNELYDQGARSFADSVVPRQPDIPAIWNDGDAQGACFDGDHTHIVDSCAVQAANQLRQVLEGLQSAANPLAKPAVIDQFGPAAGLTIQAMPTSSGQANAGSFGIISSDGMGSYHLVALPATLTRVGGYFGLINSAGNAPFAEAPNAPDQALWIEYDGVHMNPLAAPQGQAFTLCIDSNGHVFSKSGACQ